MSESVGDEQVNIERILLWQDIAEIFRANAFIMGVQTDLEPRDVTEDAAPPTLLVLEADPEPDDPYIIQLWGRVTRKGIMGVVDLVFIDRDGDECDDFSYILDESSILQYTPEEVCPNKEDLEELRADIEEAHWSEKASRERAERLISN